MKHKQTKHPNKKLSRMKRFQRGMFGSCKNTPKGYDGSGLKVKRRSDVAKDYEAFERKYGRFLRQR